MHGSMWTSRATHISLVVAMLPRSHSFLVLRSFLLPQSELWPGAAILPTVRQSISVQLSLVDVVLLDFLSFGSQRTFSLDNAAIDCLRCAISMLSKHHPL
jgi:hypothetical protein